MTVLTHNECNDCQHDRHTNDVRYLCLLNIHKLVLKFIAFYINIQKSSAGTDLYMEESGRVITWDVTRVILLQVRNNTATLALL